MEYMEKGKDDGLLDLITQRILYEDYLKTGIVLDPELLIEAHKADIKKLKKNNR